MLTATDTEKRLRYACAYCKSPLEIPESGSGESQCPSCGHSHWFAENYIKYKFDELLFSQHGRGYLLHKVLQNNGVISYATLKEASLSLPDRVDVGRFREFLVRHAIPGTLLDVGCGPLEIPGYLASLDRSQVRLIGLDPIDSRTFAGTRIVGCGEFIPLADESVDTIVFGTSLDHSCSLVQTLSESVRVLRTGGTILIWMSDRSMSLARRLIEWLKKWPRNLLRGYRADRYWVYPDWTVLYVPTGAVDPFHTFHENPDHIVRILARLRLKLKDRVVFNKDEVFLAFSKGSMEPVPSPSETHQRAP